MNGRIRKRLPRVYHWTCVVIFAIIFPFAAQSQWSIMPLGNSITAGVGSSSGYGYRGYLLNKLQGTGCSLVGPHGTSPYNGYFISGGKIEDLYSGGYGNGTRDISSAMNTYRPDMLLIHIGTNNMNNDAAGPYSNNNGISLENTASGKLAEFLRYVSQWSNGARGDFLKRIVVCKIIPRLVSGTLDAKVIEYNAEIDRMFFERPPAIVFSRVTLVDMYHSILLSDLSDGVHPNDGGYNKMAEEFNRIIRGILAGDSSAPATVAWRQAQALGGQSALLQWEAVGDDGYNGRANLYELRYAAFELTSQNFTQGILVPIAKPAASRTVESHTVTGLVPGLTYFFGIRAYDEMNNRGAIAFSPPVDMGDTTITEYCDDFVDAAAPDWNLNPAYKVDVGRGELVNTSVTSGWNYLAAYKSATYNATARGVRADMRWSELADNAGINSSGIAMMLDRADPFANGYLVRIRDRMIYLNEIRDGSAVSQDINRYPFPISAPSPISGDVLKIKYNPSSTYGHLFNVYINNDYIGEVHDTDRLQGNRPQLYSGLMLYGGMNNAIDEFCLTVPPLEPDSMYVVAGEGKHGRVMQRLAEPLAVRVMDANGLPVSDIQVAFSVISGQASLSTDSLDVIFNGNIWQEAENGDLQEPYVTGNNANASGNEFIYVPYFSGNNYKGLAIYQIYIPKTGQYKFWLRAFAPDGYQNSCFFNMGGADTVQVTFSNWGAWHWAAYPKSISLPKGFLTLTIKNREAGTQLDKFLLTTNTNYVPQGKGFTTQRFSNITDITGSAYTFLYFSEQAGVVKVEASAPAVPKGSMQVFTVFADAADPQELQYASETILTGKAGQPLSKEFAVSLQDQYGNTCVGVQVDFTVMEGDATFSQQNSIRVSSNSEGVASARLTLGYSPSPNRIEASLPDVPEVAPLSFQAIAGEGIPVSISMISGDAQTDTVRRDLEIPLSIQVLDEKGLPVVKYPVPFQIVGNNGRLNGIENMVVDSTDTFGKAEVEWTLGDTAGVDNNIVVVDVNLNGAPVYFRASGLPDRPMHLAIVSGDNQQGYAGEPMPKPLTVKIGDDWGNGIKDHDVTFTVVSGNGKFNGASSQTVTTDAGGLASAVYTAGTSEGTNQVKVDPIDDPHITSKVFASLMVLPPRPNRLAEVAGSGQEAIVMTSLANPFKVRVTDPFGNLSANVAVRFKVTEGGGKFSGKDSVQTLTDASGEAEAVMQVGPMSGYLNHKAIAYTPNYTIAPVAFSASALPALADRMEPASDLSFSEQAETKVSLSVQVKDAYGNPRPGYTVSFDISQGNGTFANGETSAEVVSNGSGIATIEYQMGTNTRDINIISASAPKPNSGDLLDGSPIVFSGRVLAGSARQIAKIEGENQGAKALSTLATPFTIEVRDIYGNAAAQSVVVTYRVIGGGGQIGNETEIDVITNPAGQASAYLRVGPIAGINNNIVEVLIKDHPEITPVQFNASTYPGDPDILYFVSDSVWSDKVNTTVVPTVKVTDLLGNVIENFSVFFKVMAGQGRVRGIASSFSSDTVTVTTNNVGEAFAYWTFGDAPDTNKLYAYADYQDSPLRNSPALFKAITYPDDPQNLARVSAASDTGVVKQPLADPFRVKVMDANGNPVPNHAVVFQVVFPAIPELQGKLFINTLADTAATKTVYTDQDGIAAVYFLLSRERGPNHIRATAQFNNQALFGSPVTFYVEGLPSPAKRLRLIGSPQLTGKAGEVVSVRARAEDGEGKPVGGHPVQFTALDQYSSVENPLLKWVTKNTAVGSGEAEAHWLLGHVVGQNINRLQISAPSLEGSPIQVNASVTAGAPFADACRITATDSVLADNNSAAQLTVTVVDSFNNPVAGQSIQFESPDIGLTFSQPTTYTDQNGVTTGSVRSNKSGLKHISARVLGASPFTICCANIHFLPGPPVKMQLHAGNAQSGNRGTALRDSIAVLVTDALQNPVPDVEVTFTVTNGNGYLLHSQLPTLTTRTDAQGIAAAHWVLGAQSGMTNVVYATSSHANLKSVQIVFTAESLNATGTRVEKVAGDPQEGVVGSELPQPLVVRVVDAKNDPVFGALVLFTPQEADGEITSANPVTTDYAGRASARYKLGRRAGDPPQIISARINGTQIGTT
ncbi:Ig-like domain-containing protein, partial [candidate division KSB1 bacterium]|nr:Ig-like domain-containing protein [candidate division KSB1 bacterium]